MELRDMRRVESARARDYYYKGRHPSGLEIYLYPKETGSSTWAVFGTRYGSIDNCFQLSESALLETVPAGIAHYLEHKLFESEDVDAFARFARTGANANAYTGFDSTCYVFSCTDRLYDSLEILLDFVQSPYFTDETVAKERGIIAQEIKMYDDMPGWRVMFEYLRAMYHLHPVRDDAAGTLESIEQITPELLYRCHKSFYNLNNMVLVLAGRFDAEKVLEVCDKMLRPAPEISIRRIFPAEPPEVLCSRVDGYLPVAMPVFQFGYKDDGESPRTERDLAAVSAMLFVLASDSSPLFRRLLDEGLVNEASFSYQYFEGTGYANIMFGGESRYPEAAANVISEEIRRLRRDGIAPETFRRAKRSLYGDSISSLNSAGSVSSWLSDFALAGLEPFTYIDALVELSLEQVEAKLELLDEERSVLSVIWPLKGGPEKGKD